MCGAWGGALPVPPGLTAPQRPGGPRSSGSRALQKSGGYKWVLDAVLWPQVCVCVCVCVCGPSSRCVWSKRDLGMWRQGSNLVSPPGLRASGGRVGLCIRAPGVRPAECWPSYEGGRGSPEPGLAAGPVGTQSDCVALRRESTAVGVMRGGLHPHREDAWCEASATSSWSPACVEGHPPRGVVGEAGRLQRDHMVYPPHGLSPLGRRLAWACERRGGWSLSPAPEQPAPPVLLCPWSAVPNASACHMLPAVLRVRSRGWCGQGQAR